MADPCKMADPHLQTNHVHTFVLPAYAETVALIPCVMSVSPLLPPHSPQTYEDLLNCSLFHIYYHRQSTFVISSPEPDPGPGRN